MMVVGVVGVLVRLVKRVRYPSVSTTDVWDVAEGKVRVGGRAQTMVVVLMEMMGREVRTGGSGDAAVATVVSVIVVVVVVVVVPTAVEIVKLLQPTPPTPPPTTRNSHRGVATPLILV